MTRTSVDLSCPAGARKRVEVRVLSRFFRVNKSVAHFCTDRATDRLCRHSGMRHLGRSRPPDMISFVLWSRRSRTPARRRGRSHRLRDDAERVTTYIRHHWHHRAHQGRGARDAGALARQGQRVFDKRPKDRFWPHGEEAVAPSRTRGPAAASSFETRRRRRSSG